VVPIEQTQFDESNPTIVTIPVSCLSLEANLMRRGTAAVTGSVLLKSGTRLQPQQVAALAEFGFADIVVRRQPSVAVLATGDELVDCSEPLLPGQIRNSNEPMLIAQIAASDCIPNGLGIARDDESQLFESIQRGLMNDVLLLTGGVSAGILDLVPQQLARAGVRQIFHGVHMKPGKPLWFGCYESGQHRCLVFGLPGNPVSSLVCFELFVRPALRRLSGLNTERDVLKAVISDSISVRGNRPVYQPVFVSLNETRLTAQPVPWSGSSDLRATVDANGMALLLPEHGPYDRGETVDCWLWGDQQLF
jgi:molybdopterin molybdotransferase